MTPPDKDYFFYLGEKLDKIEQGVSMILSALEEDFGLTLDENFTDTPKRVAKAYREIFSGIKDIDQQLNTILASSFPAEGYDEMIISKGIQSYSMCPHHLLPVSYKIDVGYIPSSEGHVLGISKLARIVEVLASRPIIQEVLTTDIGKVFGRVKPLGVAVRVQGHHYCMMMRGIKKESCISTSFMSGAFRDIPSARQEFLTFVSS